MTPLASAPHTQAAASEGAVACRRATKHLSLSAGAAGINQPPPPNPSPTTSTYLGLAIYIPGSQRSAHLFSIGGKAETCRVCFSPPLWPSANFFFLFSSPGVSEPRVVFQKNTRWISGSRCGVSVGGAEGRPVRRDGALLLPCLGIIIFVFLFKTGWTV